MLTQSTFPESSTHSPFHPSHDSSTYINSATNNTILEGKKTCVTAFPRPVNQPLRPKTPPTQTHTHLHIHTYTPQRPFSAPITTPPTFLRIPICRPLSRPLPHSQVGAGKPQKNIQNNDGLQPEEKVGTSCNSTRTRNAVKLRKMVSGPFSLLCMGVECWSKDVIC
jgi:hypothetical protein